MIWAAIGPWIPLEAFVRAEPAKRMQPTKVIVTAVTASTMTVQVAPRTPPARSYGPPKRKRW